MKQIPTRVWLVFFLAILGCNVPTATQLVPSTPTTHPFFSEMDPTETPPPTPTVTSLPPTAVPIATVSVGSSNQNPVTAATPVPTPAPYTTPVFNTSDTITRTVFADTLDENWLIVASNTNMTFNLESDTQVHTGEYSIAITPQKDFAVFQISVRQDAQLEYPQTQAVALSFWINPGTNLIGPEDIAVAIIGSNDYPYWVSNDTSVVSDVVPVFAETSLRFAGFNYPIPPNTWELVTIYIDNLVSEPDYNNITSFYIKNGAGTVGTFYIDDIEWIMLNETPVDATIDEESTPTTTDEGSTTSATDEETPTPSATTTDEESTTSQAAVNETPTATIPATE